jgi:NitT/TauT family transport system substrate-binding protein
MKPTRKRVALGLLSVVVMVLTASIGAIAATPSTVKIGTVGGLTDAGIFIAQARGYFNEQGITLDYKVFGSSSDFMPALGSGQLDIGGIIVSAGLFNSVASGINLRVVGDKQSVMKDFCTPVYVIRKDLFDSGKHQNLGDLKGLKFAVSGKPTLGWFASVEWAKMKGLKEKDVTWVELGYPQMLPAFESKSIDIAKLIDPFTTKIIDARAGVLIGDDWEVTPDGTVVPIVYSEAFATQKRDLGQKFMVAYVKGVREYNDAYRKNKNRAEITKILADATKMNPALVESMRKGGLDPDQKVSKKWIIATQDFLFDHKYVHQKIDIDKLIDPSFAEYAVKQLGPYRY